MDHIYRRPELQRVLRVLNQKEDRDLQRKLIMLDKQHRYTQKMLQQRRDKLINEARRMVMVQVCEPKATVSIAMKEIAEYERNADANFSRAIYTSAGRLRPSKSSYEGSKLVEQGRSISAPPPSTKSTSSVRHKGKVQSNLSLMQMKQIATIDSISEKELARQQQKAQEEMERLRLLQREMLHKKVMEFIEKLKDKKDVEVIMKLS